MEAIALAVNHWQTLLLILTRVSGLMLAAPVLSHRAVPPPLRVGLTLLLSTLLLPIHAAAAAGSSLPDQPLVWLMGTELAVGVLIGFTAALTFAAFQAAGGLVGLQAGLGLGGAFEPLNGSQASAIDHVYILLATLLFLVVDGHHLLIRALASTFDSVPPGHAAALDFGNIPLGLWSGQALAVAVQIALPLLVALILADVALALLARTVPQINVLILGLPLKLVVCFAALAAALPMTLAAMGTHLGGMGRQLELLARSW